MSCLCVLCFNILCVVLATEPQRFATHRARTLSSFTGGYVEANLLFPGDHFISGFWPAFWLMVRGNQAINIQT